MFSFNQRSARRINRNIDSTSENEDAAAPAAASANQDQQRLQQQPTSSSSATESSQLLENPHPNYSMMNDNNDDHFGNSDGNNVNRTGIRGVLNNFNVNREHDPEEQEQAEEEDPLLLNNFDNNQSPPEPPRTETPPNTNQNENEITRQITTLTNRLRVIFYTLYIPIIPLSALLILLLLQLTYESLHSPTCSYPLRTFSFSSMFLALYIPNHKIVKRWLFNYSRERDGLVRPRRVRIYDQCFHMLCLTYLYMDMVLIETCKDDVVTVMVGGGSGGDADADAYINADINADMNANNNNMTMDSLQVSTCETTCPDLYPLLQKYDLVLRIFSVILVMPLICLPFVYVWIMRRINTAEELLQMDLGGLGVGGGMDDDFLGGGVLVKDVMDGLREVILVGENANADANACADSDVNGDEEEGNKRTALKVIGKNGVKSWTQVQWKQDHQREGGDGDTTMNMNMNMNMNVAKECCICMNDFEVENEKSGSFVPTSSAMSTITPTPANNNTNTKDTMISNSNTSQVIVETKCLHLFHRECIGAWIGGVNWEEASLNHRARRRCCPLCREDLAIVSSTSSGGGGGGSGSGRNRDENGGANAAESA